MRRVREEQRQMLIDAKNEHEMQETSYG